MATTKDQRGFGVYASFDDSYGAQVQVKQSSAASEPCVWIFASGGGTVSGEADRRTAPHLTIGQAREVRDAVTEWLEDAEAGRV